MSATITSLEPINSTSFVDVLGMSIGLVRFAGETSYSFGLRIAEAAARDRSGTYQGALAELCALLGLQMNPGIRITSTDPSAVVICSMSGLSIIGQYESINAPIVYTAADTVWVWYHLSDIVATINASNHYRATLLVENALAIQLSAQTNQLYYRESVLGQQFNLTKTGYLPNSILFDISPMPTFTLQGQILTFASPPPEGANIMYQYISWPFEAVVSDAGFIGLADPAFAPIATYDGSHLAYQPREFLQAVMLKDRSYWAK